MADSPITFKVDPNKELQKVIKEAIGSFKDLSIVFKLITNDWFKSNRAIFTLKGPGKYTDLAPDSGRSTYDYKTAKEKAVGFVYPILKRSGLLAASITDPTDTNSVNLILNGTTLVLGTKVPYAHAHQDGTKRLPIRPVIFTNGEQSSPDDMYNRNGAWIKIVQDYALQMSAKVGKVTT